MPNLGWKSIFQPVSVPGLRGLFTQMKILRIKINFALISCTLNVVIILRFES
jgi:hypothetical protein